jgi:DNA-binding response OmpR family regulator
MTIFYEGFPIFDYGSQPLKKIECSLLSVGNKVYYIESVETGKKALFINNTAAPPLLAGLLIGTGFGVDVAHDSETGLRQLELNVYDIAVVVENDGPESWQICRRIRNLTAVPLIVINANASPDACARAIHAGADYCLRKPLGPQEFLARVNSLLQRSSLRPALPIGA